MSELFSILLLSISANLDTFLIFISHGALQKKISLVKGTLMTLITTVGTFLSMELGKLFTGFLPLRIANMSGGLLLLAIGIWYFYDCFRDKEAEEDSTPQNLSLKETALLSLFLTANNAGIGVAAGITEMNVLLCTLATFFVTIVCILSGILVGKKAAGIFTEKRASMASAIMLIVLGILECFL